jgi:hypothetical protein
LETTDRQRWRTKMASPKFDLNFRPPTYWIEGPALGDPARGHGLPLLGNAPGFGDGSYLPPIGGAETEIAAVGLESTTGDVISVSARPDKGRIRLRIVDEYGTRFRIKDPLRDQPLTLGELVEVMDTVRHGGMVGLVEAYLDFNYEGLEGQIDPRSLLDFVKVRSEFYPDLEKLYAERAMAWVKHRVAAYWL